mgnify:CR=1 FL=1
MVIEQKVTGAEAFRAQRLLVRRFGTPAPGPAQQVGAGAYGMVCPPTAEQWARVPSWEWLRAGVEQFDDSQGRSDAAALTMAAWGMMHGIATLALAEALYSVSNVR